MYHTYTEKIDLAKSSVICYSSLDMTKYNQNTSSIFLTYNLAKIQNIVRSPAATNSTFGLMSLVRLTLSIIIALAYTISLGALFIALMVRMAILWIMVAFSPVIVILFFNDLIPGVQQLEEYLGLGQFIKWAFSPAAVGAVFSVAFLMVTAGQNINETGGIGIVGKFQGIGGGEFSLYGYQNLFSGMSSLDEILWMFMTMAIMWIGTFAILGKLPIVNKVTDGIKGYAESAAKFMATTPLNAPIFTVGGTKTSIMGTLKGLSPMHQLKDMTNKWADLNAPQHEKQKRELENTSAARDFLAAIKSESPDADKIYASIKTLGNHDSKWMTTLKDNERLLDLLLTGKKDKAEWKRYIRTGIENYNQSASSSPTPQSES